MHLRRRRGFGALGLAGVLALLVGGFVVFSTVRVLGEFMGSSGGSGGGHQTPPVPAAPRAANAGPSEAASSPAVGSSALSEAAAACRDLERRLLAAVEAGRVIEAERLRADLVAARRRRDSLRAAAP